MPSGLSAQPKGSVPTGIVLITARVVALMTDTVPLTMLVTYTLALLGVMATHHGSIPTGTSATFWTGSSAALKTETELLSGFTLQTN